MGLDGVELVLGVEKAFSISISDEEAEAIRTPRQLTDLVVSRLAAARSSGCHSQIAFHRLRQGLVSVLGISRKAVTPESHWRQFLPISGRRRAWQALSRSVQLPLPALVRPSWLVALVLSGSVFPGALAYRTVGISWGILAFGFSASMLGVASLPARVAFPSRCATLGATARYLSAFAPAQLIAPPEPLTRAQVREVVHGIIREVLAISEVPEDARFVEDLGVS
jgi:acyl carrier protein